MLDSLKARIENFTNEKNYIFDFDKNDLLDLEDGFYGDRISLSIFDNINDFELLELFISDKNSNKSKTYKLPKKITKKWIVNKIDNFLNTEDGYRNLTSLFKRLNFEGNFYSASYGIGYIVSHGNVIKFTKDTELIENKLKSLGIEFKVRFSDQRWVLRYIISTKKENLKKLQALK